MDNYRNYDILINGSGWGKTYGYDIERKVQSSQWVGKTL